MHGDPALPPDFVSLPYADPAAPKGGEIVIGETGGFDSLNPYIVKGRAPALLRELTVESLMGRSLDEPFTLYGLLAESVETPSDRAWVEFTLRPEARFSDGAPVTVADVIWSLETVGTRGSPVYAGAWAKVAGVRQTGERSLRIDFNAPDRELPLILGLRPVLERAAWEGRDFAASSLAPIVGSGPYVVAKVEPGRSITYAKDPGWWGASLSFNAGRHNLDRVRVEYFTDDTAKFEAFKAGFLTTYREPSAAKWQSSYGFPRVSSGEVRTADIPYGRPSGMQGFAFNTRRALFADWRVREALIRAFDFEFVNATVNGGAQPRIASYFSASPLGMRPGPATGAVRDLLAPYAASLLPGALEGYALPVADPGGRNRTGLGEARRLLGEAGWTVEGGVLRDADGAPFRFEILLQQGTGGLEAAAAIYVEALKRLGIDARVATVDSAQYVARTLAYDFDMTQYLVALSLSPGNEEYLYWGRAGVTEPGTRNLMGIDAPAVEPLIAAQLAADDPAAFTAATQALDRVLTTGRYVIPLWYAAVSHLAYDRRLRYPARLPLYGDIPGFQPDVWWWAE